MSSEMRETKAPRSLTLTFAETHPWEMLVRDRLVSLPRGHLKRFLLHLIEQSGVDLENDDVFRAQVESVLMSRHRGLVFPAAEDIRRQSQPPVGAANIPAAARKPSAPQWDTGAAAEPSRIERKERDEDRAPRKKPVTGSDSGFGALEI